MAKVSENSTDVHSDDEIFTIVLLGNDKALVSRVENNLRGIPEDQKPPNHLDVTSSNEDIAPTTCQDNRDIGDTENLSVEQHCDTESPSSTHGKDEDSSTSPSRDIESLAIVNKVKEDCSVIKTPDLKSSPGPHVFLLVLAKGEQPAEQLARWEQQMQQRNMYYNTIIIMDTKNLNKDSKFANKCLDINTEMGELVERCKIRWSESIRNRYCYTNYSQEAEKQLEKGSPDKKRQRQDVDDSNRHHDGEATKELKICLLGESGSGKSCSGNTILGSNVFLSKVSAAPVTTQCKLQSTSIFGTEIRVIDTPDFFDDYLESTTQVTECRKLCKEGLCLYLLVIQIGRFTEGERSILERLENKLGGIRKRTIILFTHGDDLDQHIDDYVKDTNTGLRQLIRQCGDRYQVFNNKNRDEGRGQVEELMRKIVTLAQETRKS